MGVKVTPKNRREVRDNFKKNWIRRNENEGNPENLTPEEIDTISSKVANVQVRKEQKHLKAYLRGQAFYKFYGHTEPVMTQEVIDFQAKQMQAVQDAHKNEEE